MTNKRTLDNLQNILRGDEEQPDKGATGATQEKGLAGLNQLSAVAEKMEKHNTSGQQTQHIPTLVLPSQNLSQEQLIDAPVPLQFQQPSQPDIPLPILPESQTQTQGMHMQNAEETKMAVPNMMLNQEMMNQIMLTNQFADLTQFQAAWPYAMMQPADDETAPAGGAGRKSQGRKQTRRGPMDEMRQLVRILVKILPHSIAYISSGEEVGGGNRISEEQIRSYLTKTLGDGPQPTWGVPSGWHGFLAELFSWVTGKTISPEQAQRVAKREPGRSWEAVESELHELGVHPNSWPLPLTLEGVQEAEKNPVPLPVPPIAVIRKMQSEEGGNPAPAPTQRRSRAVATERDLEKMSEEALWKLIVDGINAAVNKHNTTTNESTQANILALKMQAKAKIDELMTGMGMYSYLPLVSGMEQNIFNLLQNFPAAGGNNQSFNMEGMDPQQQAALLAALTAGNQQMMMDPATMAAAAAVAAGQGIGGGDQQQQYQQQQQEGGNQRKKAKIEPTDDGGEEHKPKGPLSSTEARGTLFGALGGGVPAIFHQPGQQQQQ